MSILGYAAHRDVSISRGRERRLLKASAQGWLLDRGQHRTLGATAWRTNGPIQHTCSLTVGYVLFLAWSLVILVGCLLEAYGGLRPISDAVRKMLYSKSLYENDLRDVLFYNRVRPKFFASEPASVALCYTLFAFLWLVASPWRWKPPASVGLIAAGCLPCPGQPRC